MKQMVMFYSLEYLTLILLFNNFQVLLSNSMLHGADIVKILLLSMLTQPNSFNKKDHQQDWLKLIALFTKNFVLDMKLKDIQQFTSLERTAKDQKNTLGKELSKQLLIGLLKIPHQLNKLQEQLLSRLKNRLFMLRKGVY